MKVTETAYKNNIINSTYPNEDVTFLLKDLSDYKLEGTTESRELRIQSGEHYSESLPVEYQPPESYMSLYHSTLHDYKRLVALYVGVVSEQIYQQKGSQTVLVSLARAGTPVGILIRRYLMWKYNISLPHYSISIIRGKGIDENAIHYILKQHPNAPLQFVDGWTGKGAISKVLTESCLDFQSKYGILLDDTLAVVADPGHCTTLFGTREDFLIPSACLNSTVTGLVSRTVLNDQYIGPHDFHGAKFYQDLRDSDVSNEFIQIIMEEFDHIKDEVIQHVEKQSKEKFEASFSGMETVKKIMNEFHISDMNFVKPGVGETTRVLLRRVPWKILIKDVESPYIKHILMLAEERNVEVEHYPNMEYTCCGLIKKVR